MWMQSSFDPNGMPKWGAAADHSFPVMTEYISSLWTKQHVVVELERACATTCAVRSGRRWWGHAENVRSFQVIDANSLDPVEPVQPLTEGTNGRVLLKR